jgi:hypothetical protein
VGQVHLDAAEALLRSDSLDEHRLRSELDPLAAASAAIPYLAAALHETASAAHLPLHRVMDEAADMEETDKTGCDAARAVIDRLFEVDDPQRVATHLVSECKDAAAGCLPDMRRLLADINVAKASARRLAPGDRAVRDEFLDAIRATPLEPLRPAPSLLDAVLAGIEGCFHVWRHHASATTGAAADFDDELDDALENAMEEARRQEFWAHVQARVAAEHGGIRAFASVM